MAEREGFAAALGGVDELAVHLRAHGHLDQIVVHIAFDPRVGGEFDVLTGMHVAHDHAVDDRVGDSHVALDRPAIAQRQYRHLLVLGAHGSTHDAIDVQAAAESQIALNLGILPNQCIEAGCLALALFPEKHRSHPFAWTNSRHS